MTLNGRLIRRVLLALAVVVLLAAVWVGYQAWQVASSLRAAASEAEGLQSALSNGEESGIDERVAAIQAHSSEAADRTSGTTWSALTHVPVFGDDARAVRLVSATLDDLTGSGLAPLAESASDLESFLPSGGAIPLDALQRLQQPVADADQAFSRADEDLSAEDPTNFVAPLRDRYRELARQVSDGASALSTADTALQVLPSMLGSDGPRNYLLVFQNNAEVRATGGLPGAVTLLRVVDGKLTLARQAAGNSFGETAQPVLPLTEAEQQIYGPQLGTYFLDANFTPDFPRASALMKARWEQEYDDQIDGVIALDPVALSYLLEGLGPITVGDQTLTSENVVDELLSTTYSRLPDPADQDVFFRDVATTVFNGLTSGSQNPRATLSGLRRAAQEHRILVHSFDDTEQESLVDTAVGGALVTESTDHPQVGLYLNDTTGAKMSYYLRYEASVDATSCRGGVQTISGKSNLQSLAPADAASTLPDYVTGGDAYGIPPGSQLVTVRLYAPVGGTIESLSINGEVAADLGAVDQDGRQVVTTYVQLEAQQTADLAWTMRSGADQAGDVDLSVTPGVAPQQDSSQAASAC